MRRQESARCFLFGVPAQGSKPERHIATITRFKKFILDAGTNNGKMVAKWWQRHPKTFLTLPDRKMVQNGIKKDQQEPKKGL